MSEREEEREELDERGPGDQHPSDHRRHEREAQPIPVHHHLPEKSADEIMNEAHRAHAARKAAHARRH